MDFKRSILTIVYTDQSRLYFTPDMRRSIYSTPPFQTNISTISPCTEMITKGKWLLPNKSSFTNRDHFGCVSPINRPSSSSCFHTFFITSSAVVARLSFLRRKTGTFIINYTSLRFVTLWYSLTLRNGATASRSIHTISIPASCSRKGNWITSQRSMMKRSRMMRGKSGRTFKGVEDTPTAAEVWILHLALTWI